MVVHESGHADIERFDLARDASSGRLTLTKTEQRP
jgi:hypothetical protein